MYIIKDNNIKNLDKKNELIQKYDLKYIDKFKQYRIQNIDIISNKISFNFYKKYNKQIIKNLEIYNIHKIITFSFFFVDDEKVYELYTNNDDNILLKIYNNYLTIEYLTEDLNNLELINK